MLRYIQAKYLIPSVNLAGKMNNKKFYVIHDRSGDKEKSPVFQNKRREIFHHDIVQHRSVAELLSIVVISSLLDRYISSVHFGIDTLVIIQERVRQ